MCMNLDHFLPSVHMCSYSMQGTVSWVCLSVYLLSICLFVCAQIRLNKFIHSTTYLTHNKDATFCGIFSETEVNRHAFIL